jgi:hypothetical protein
MKYTELMLFKSSYLIPGIDYVFNIFAHTTANRTIAFATADAFISFVDTLHNYRPSNIEIQIEHITDHQT